MTELQHLIKLLTDPGSPLFMMQDQYIAQLAAILPIVFGKEAREIIPYENLQEKHMSKLPAVGSINLTGKYASNEIPEDSIAYYRVSGTITSESWSYFSTKEMQLNLQTADTNNQIGAHFLHITSGGGEAWYLDQLAATLRNMQKPVHAFIERVAGSAAYYIASQSDFISAATPFDVIGSIGTMVSFMDIEPMFQKWGMKIIQEYATDSDLKNKKYNDLIKNDKPDQFIKEELDPLRNQFVKDVKEKRKSIATLKDDHPVLRGETFYADKAVKNGLIDAVETYQQAITRLGDQIQNNKQTKQSRTKALQFINS